MYWSAVRGFGERALANGALTMTDIRSGVAAACTLPKCAELLSPLPDTTRTNSACPDEPLRFFVEMERGTIAWLCRLGLIQRNEAYDLGALLIALKRIGLTPTIALSR
jgi:hypothetical protein